MQDLKWLSGSAVSERVHRELLKCARRQCKLGGIILLLAPTPFILCLVLGWGRLVGGHVIACLVISLLLSSALAGGVYQMRRQMAAISSIKRGKFCFRVVHIFEVESIFAEYGDEPVYYAVTDDLLCERVCITSAQAALIKHTGLSSGVLVQPLTTEMFLAVSLPLDEALQDEGYVVAA